MKQTSFWPGRQKLKYYAVSCPNPPHNLRTLKRLNQQTMREGHTFNFFFSAFGRANISRPPETRLSSKDSGMPWFIACFATAGGRGGGASKGNYFNACLPLLYTVDNLHLLIAAHANEGQHAPSSVAGRDVLKLCRDMTVYCIVQH